MVDPLGLFPAQLLHETLPALPRPGRAADEPSTAAPLYEPT